ncbi:hypothetical protein N473_20595 [Pseudoalteromonas luteoviolacea CPMOR-1]|uniref:Peptidase M12A domain-containing protein n=1 Tax=Pseudoalteromonas luteoviolacea CPMOR-1 TaxID=1365248 RepID=A0A167K0T5_9GAMM|nr:M12 family metallopeptidase [Pseudoalteromonas luteoviolacea]KZN61944.1 hypothetical protein N473_20595 [Pseudoalteromonas luteoviolacea CPMOR-1]
MKKLKLLLLGFLSVPVFTNATISSQNEHQPIDHNFNAQTEYYVEGDMVFDESARHTNLRTIKTSGLDSAVAWPRGTVPYQLVNIVNGSQHEKNILKAMENLERASGVNFIRKTSSHTNYLAIYGNAYNAEAEKYRVCHAQVGYGNGGVRKTWIPSYCGVSTATHELMHVLGFRHEHQRTDRDYHQRDGHYYSMTVNEEFIPCGLQGAYSTSIYVARTLPYDHESIMHYRNYSRTGCETGEVGKTFMYKNTSTGEAFEDTGNTRLSQGDLRSLRQVYARNRSQTPTILGPDHTDKASLRYSVVWYQVHDYPDYFRVNETSEEFIDINQNGQLDTGEFNTYRVDANAYWRDAFEIYFGDSTTEKRNGYRYRYTVQACWNNTMCSNESGAKTYSVLQKAQEPELYIDDSTPGDKEFYLRWNKQIQVQYVKISRNGVSLGDLGGESLKQNLSTGTYQYEVEACNERGCSEPVTLTHHHIVAEGNKPTESPYIESLAFTEYLGDAEFEFRKVARATEYRFQVNGQGINYTGSVFYPYSEYGGGYARFYTRSVPQGSYQVTITPCNSNGCGPKATKVVYVELDT